MCPGLFIDLDPFLWRYKPPAFYPRDYPVKSQKKIAVPRYERYMRIFLKHRASQKVKKRGYKSNTYSSLSLQFKKKRKLTSSLKIKERSASMTAFGREKQISHAKPSHPAGVSQYLNEDAKSLIVCLLLSHIHHHHTVLYNVSNSYRNPGARCSGNHRSHARRVYPNDLFILGFGQRRLVV